MSSENGRSGSLGKRHGFGSKDAARCDDECSALRVHVQRAACAYAPHWVFPFAGLGCTYAGLGWPSKGFVRPSATCKRRFLLSKTRIGDRREAKDMLLPSPYRSVASQQTTACLLPHNCLRTKRKRIGWEKEGCEGTGGWLLRAWGKVCSWEEEKGMRRDCGNCFLGNFASS